ncbi:MAG: acetylglutamate kinase [Odoribacteraceae bacterium]|jgi:acetylglutamate kinase|nr:acetylglutamate kinase [Odoribacteraceae bacterium]
MKEMNCTVIKVGGTFAENEEKLDRLAARLAAFPGMIVVVHGGGVLADKLCDALAIPREKIDGRRVTDDETLRVTVMAYAGWVNKSIVAALQRAGVNACGLSGCDERLVVSARRPAGTIDWGRVGDVERVNAHAIARFVNRGVAPVISPITLGAGGELLNTNADSVAGAVAGALVNLYTVDLIFCVDAGGVLADPADPASILPALTRRDREALDREKAISAGMIPKLDNAFRALDAGARSVRLVHPDDLGNEERGTKIIAP